MKNYKILWEDKGVLTEFIGTLTIHDLIEYSGMVQACERFDQVQYFLHDMRETDMSKIDFKDIDGLVAMAIGVSYTVSSGKIAIVATNPHIISLSEYRRIKHKEFGLRWEIGIFQTLAAAREWIG